MRRNKGGSLSPQGQAEKALWMHGSTWVRPRRRPVCAAASEESPPHPRSGREGALGMRRHQKGVSLSRVRLPEKGQRQGRQCGHQGRECRSGSGRLRKASAQRRSDSPEEPNAQQKGSKREECSQAVCAARSRNRLGGAKSTSDASGKGQKPSGAVPEPLPDGQKASDTV